MKKMTKDSRLGWLILQIEIIDIFSLLKYKKRKLKVSRLLTGPEVSGSRPVVVTFEAHRDREEASP